MGRITFRGSGWVGSGQGYPTRPVIFETLLIRPNPTREISNISRPDLTRPVGFEKAPDSTRGPDLDP